MKQPVSMDLPEFVKHDFGIPPFLVDPLLPYGGIGLVFGKRGAGKTQFAFTLARAIINGESLFEKYSCPYGRVAYISCDIPIQMLQDRMDRFYDTLDDPYCFHVTGFDARFDIIEATENSDWVKDINAHEPDLVIVDTLRKSHSMDENMAAAAAYMFGHAKTLFDEAALLFLHHDRKDHKDNHGTPEEEKAAGSGAWLDNSDLGIHVTKRHSKLTVSFPRVRFCAEEDARKVQCHFGDDLLLHVDKSQWTAKDHAQNLRMRFPAISKADLIAQLEAENFSQAQAYRAFNDTR